MIEEFLFFDNYEILYNIQGITGYMINKVKTNDMLDPERDIYVTFLNNGKIDKKPHSKIDLKKFFSFIKIFYGNNNYFNLIINYSDQNPFKILEILKNSELFKQLYNNIYVLLKDYVLIENNTAKLNSFDKIYFFVHKNNINKNIILNGNTNINKINNINNNNLQNNQFLNINMKFNSAECYSHIINNLVNKYFKDINIEGNEAFFPLIGLRNVGLTCYMNSTLQCLLHIPELNNFFFNIYSQQKGELQDIQKNTETKGEISQEYANIVNKVCRQTITGEKHEKRKSIFGLFFQLVGYGESNNSPNQPYSPIIFNDLICKYNPQFSKYESNDAKDLILYLFQVMHEELNYFGNKRLGKIPKCNQLIENDSFMFFFQVNSCLNFSIISYLFYGIVKTITICSHCNKQLFNFQYFQFLSFPLSNYNGKFYNIYQGFKEFIKEDLFSGNNQCYCQYCKTLKDAKVMSKLYYTPPYLLINLDYGKNKRFIPKSIDFGEIIEINDFCEENYKKNDYELIAVSTHLGASGIYGHYKSFCKDQNKTWHEFNDSRHSISSINEVKRDSPYLLLYKKIK